MKKRAFLKSLVSIGALLAISPVACVRPTEKKRALILGGRGFLGPTIVKTFLNAGYDVTLLNRGKTNPDMFTDLSIIICDRERENREGLLEVKSQINEHHWDVVVDTWSKSPKAVEDFLGVFKNNVKHYHYVSSIAVYKNYSYKVLTETTPLKELPKFPEMISEKFRYSIRKALSEKAIIESNVKFTIHRSHGMRAFRTPEPIYEPYWAVKFHRGGEVLLPLQENHYLQVTDVVSYCKFIERCSDKSITGIFNVARDRMLFKDYIKKLITVAGKPKMMHWIPAKFLIENKVIPYRKLPLWRPKPIGFYNVDISKAKKAGLRNRPIVEMLKDRLDGYKFRNPNDDFVFGENGTLSDSKEREVIDKWNNTLK